MECKKKCLSAHNFHYSFPFKKNLKHFKHKILKEDDEELRIDKKKLPIPFHALALIFLTPRVPIIFIYKMLYHSKQAKRTHLRIFFFLFSLYRVWKNDSLPHSSLIFVFPREILMIYSLNPSTSSFAFPFGKDEFKDTSSFHPRIKKITNKYNNE